MAKSAHNPSPTGPHRIRQILVRTVIRLFGLVGISVLFYIGFSFFFDTPTEYSLKQQTAQLREEYEKLSMRYDTLERVLNNVVERDRNVFGILFESEPYELDSRAETDRWKYYEKLLTHSNNELADVFFSKIRKTEKSLSSLAASYARLDGQLTSAEGSIDRIPSIQPVINPGLTLLTASYGMRIHPFYRSLQSHQGVDYTIPVGSRVFATADGVVKDVISRNTTSGLTVVISHGNGYETRYSNLSHATVRRGEKVHRGDIIALSGNSGLSLAPHLHYEVSLNGMRIDPVHYFFMELSPDEYQKIMGIARSGMQSFD